MKTVNKKQLGFFDPVTGLTLLIIFGLSAAGINAAKTSDAEQQAASIETAETVAQADFRKN
jgi:hypothetical protein